MVLSKKREKTTIVAAIGTLLVLAVFVFYFLGKIESSDLGIALSAVGVAVGILTGLFAKDSDKKESIENNNSK